MAEVRLIDGNKAEAVLRNIADHLKEDGNTDLWPATYAAADVIKHQPTIDPESLRPQGRWDWKHRHKGGFHKYTGVDAFGEKHTITVDERFECDEPYCPNCGKLNESTCGPLSLRSELPARNDCPHHLHFRRLR